MKKLTYREGIILEKENIKLREEYDESILKDIIAFLNSFGGIIYLGITEEEEIKGIDNILTIENKINFLVEKNIVPNANEYININKGSIEGKNIIKIKVERGSYRPYYIKNLGMNVNGVYVIQKGNTVSSTRTNINNMIMEVGGNSFESYRSLEQNLTFRGTKLAFEVLNINFDNKLQKELKIIGEDELYTNLGLLLSDQNPYDIKLVVYNKKENKIKNKFEIKGSLIKQLQELLKMLNIFNEIETKIDKNNLKIEQKSYPEEAIFQTVVNILIHRNYELNTSTIITIDESQIEFLSPGNLTSSQLDLLLGVQKLRNKNIMEFFVKIKLVNNCGFGLKLIKRFYEEKNINFSGLEYTDEAVKITLPNINFTPEIEIIRENPLDESQEKILEFLKNNGESNSQKIQNFLKLSQTKVNNSLKRLIELKLVEKFKNGKKVFYMISKENR